MTPDLATIAYFSMEIALDPSMPTYSGGLGVLAGDTLRAAADVVVHHYTRTRGRDGPAKFLEGYKGYLQADAYSVYDAFFKPARGLTEVGCMMHYPDSGVI